MVNLTVPGVKIQEVATLPPSVAAVDTSIPVFIGYTEKNGGTIRKISSFLEFEQLFGGPQQVAVEITLLSGNTVNSDINASVVIPSPDLTYLLYYSVKAFYDNGGGACYIASADTYQSSPSVVLAKLEDALEDLVSKEDEPTIIVIPDAINIGSSANYGTIYNKALDQAKTLGDRFVILDTYPNAVFATEVSTTRSTITNNLRYGAAYYPRLKTVYNLVTNNALITVKPGTGFTADTLNDLIVNNSSIFTPVLVNQILVAVNAKLSQTNVTIGPSGAMAGIYSRVDADRGVWKAPANVALTGIADLDSLVSDDRQSQLNVDATGGKSINAIRFFSGQGILVWGARTLAGNDNDWRYVNVRRLLIFIEESCRKASSQFVFEPNTGQTWQRVKGMIENFLLNQWRQGALAGAKPEDAFFVRVGLGSTMNSQDILEGVMNVEIGVAPSKPAEFIVLKFSHKLQTS